jgi:hydroxymethylglutaryl-CoA lyase
MKQVKLIECPRDAMQGITPHFIPTESKAQYINALLRVGFDTIDFGSFVSPKAIKKISKYFNSRLHLELIPATDENVLISRVKVPEFLEWMDK